MRGWIGKWAVAVAIWSEFDVMIYIVRVTYHLLAVWKSFRGSIGHAYVVYEYEWSILST